MLKKVKMWPNRPRVAVRRTMVSQNALSARVTGPNRRGLQAQQEERPKPNPPIPALAGPSSCGGEPCDIE